MPVLVTGAESRLGARVLDLVGLAGGEVRAYLDATAAGDDDAARLRATGYKVALGELDDEGLLEAALEQVHTVAHCWTGPLHDPAQQVEVAAVLGSALLGAGARRLVWVRELARATENPYLAAAAEVRDLFHALPLETVTLSTALRYADGDELTTLLRAGWLCGTGVDPDAAHAPIHIDDVARAIAAADRQRGSSAEVHLELALVGPERHTLRGFLAQLGAPSLGAPRPSDLRPPEDWLVDWLSRPASEETLTGDGAPAVVRGADRLTGP